MIKIDNNIPNDITWTENNQLYTVAAIQKDGVYVYGRSGTYKTGTLPTGVASLSCTKTSATCEPTSTTGAVANNATIYHGDRLYWTATASTYWTASVPYYNSSSSAYFTDFKTTRTATGVSLCGVTASRNQRDVSVTLDSNLNSIALSFTNTDGESDSETVSASRNVFGVWQGGTITYTPNPKLYWEASAGTIAAGTTAVTINPAPTRKERSVTATINSNISSIAISYTNLSGNSASATKTSTGSVSGVWQGDSISYTPTAATYYTASSGSYAAGTSAVNISPTANRASRSVTATLNANVTSIAITYTSALSGNSASTTKTSSGAVADVWQGASITYTPATPAYWTASGGTIAAGAGAVTIAPTASRTPRSVSVNVNENISSVKVTYTETGTGQSINVTKTSSGSIANVWQGAGVSYTVTPATYWTSSGGSYEAGTSAITISPTASRATRTTNVTINEHVTSVTANFTNTSGSSASSTRTTSGAIASVWQGADITYTVATDTYWTASGGTISAGTGTATIAPTASRASRSVTTIFSSHIASIAVTYTNLSGSSETTTKTSDDSVSGVWQGAGITYSVTTDAYWSSSGGSYSAGTSAVSIVPTATRTARSVSVTINNNVNAITVNYTNTSGESKSETIASNRSITGVWQGAQITYTASAATYWSAPGGSYTAGTSSVSISPTASRSPRSTSVTKPSGVAMTVTGTAYQTGNSDTTTVPTANSYSNNTSVVGNKYWQGAQITWSATAPSGFVITPTSGTINAGTGTATISTAYTTANQSIFTGSKYITWTASEMGAAKAMSFTTVSAASTGTIADKGSIYITGTWYPTSSSVASVTKVTYTDVEVPTTAYNSSTAVTIATYTGNKVLKAYRSAERLYFLVQSGTSAMRNTVTEVKAQLYQLGQATAPEVDDDGPYGVYIENPNPYPVKLYINGHYLTSEQDQIEYRNEYYDTIAAGDGIYWSGITDEFLDANLNFYFAGGSTQASNASNYTY